MYSLCEYSIKQRIASGIYAYILNIVCLKTKQVEQLKTHLQRMGGAKDVGDHRRNIVSRRPRLRPHHLKERSTGVAGAAAMVAPARTVPAVATTPSRRSAAVPLSIPSDSPPAIFYRRGGSQSGGGGGGGGGGGSTVGGATIGLGEGRRRSRSVDMMGRDCNSKREGGREDGRNDADMYGDTKTTAYDAHCALRTAPSPPRLQERRPSDGRLSGLPAGAITTGVTPSPMRRLRSVRLRSPESSSETRNDREADSLLLGVNGTYRSEGSGGGKGRISEETEERCSLNVATNENKREVDGPGDEGEVLQASNRTGGGGEGVFLIH